MLTLAFCAYANPKSVLGLLSLTLVWVVVVQTFTFWTLAFLDI